MLQIIPKPGKAIEHNGTFTLDATTGVCFDGAFAQTRPFFDELVTSALSGAPTPCESADAPVAFLLDEKVPEEGYRISCGGQSLRVYASANAGAFYAVQTLRQLFEADRHQGASSLTMPCVEIEDAPRFSWRGLALDESRHFFGMEEVKRLLDLMAWNKLNVLHWHLTDDQGWRIEIKKYPLLTEIGSKRKDTNIHGWNSTDMEGKPHEGFYTREQIRELVAYAAARHIMVVPEIDMPAHFAAAMAAYNWLGCREIPCEVQWFFGATVPKSMGWEDWNRPACAGKESTYTFIFEVLEEICELFPAPYFHIGGDEAPKDEWKKCPACQKAIQEHGLKNEEELQGYFNNRIAEYLKRKGKRLIVWNETLHAGNLDKTVIGQYWTPQRDRAAEAYINQGGDMIMSKHQAFYFDMYYSQRRLQKTYGFEPIFGGIKPSGAAHVLGVEGEVWTEFIADREKLDLDTHPRMEALSEVGWSPKDSRSLPDFLTRMHHREALYDQVGVNYAVDAIAMPKGPIRRVRRTRQFYTCDQHVEVRLNREQKEKK